MSPAVKKAEKASKLFVSPSMVVRIMRKWAVVRLSALMKSKSLAGACSRGLGGLFEKVLVVRNLARYSAFNIYSYGVPFFTIRQGKSDKNSFVHDYI